MMVDKNHPRCGSHNWMKNAIYSSFLAAAFLFGFSINASYRAISKVEIVSAQAEERLEKVVVKQEKIDGKQDKKTEKMVDKLDEIRIMLVKLMTKFGVD